jgi:hypothetical protein
MKLSQWHDGNVKPVHVGVYERDNSGYLGMYSYWNGKYWTFGFYENSKHTIIQSKKVKALRNI